MLGLVFLDHVRLALWLTSLLLLQDLSALLETVILAQASAVGMCLAYPLGKGHDKPRRIEGQKETRHTCIKNVGHVEVV
jgi:hypothetical protein